MPIQFFEILKYLRKKKGLTQEQLANNCGISKSAVSMYENGKRIPDFETLELFADYFNVNLQYLISGESSKSNITVLDSSNLFNIPTYNSVSAGFGALAVNEVVDYTPLYIESKEEAKETICIKVKGDSMFPKIEDGDLIQVHKQDSVDSGSVAVCLLDGDNGVVKKMEYKIGEDWLELRSFNPMYPVMRFEGSDVQRVRVVGLVKKVIKNL